MKRYSPNPVLIASSSQLRMLEVDDGEYVSAEDALALDNAINEIVEYIWQECDLSIHEFQRIVELCEIAKGER